MFDATCDALSEGLVASDVVVTLLAALDSLTDQTDIQGGRGADSHGQVGNLSSSNAVMFDWLEETLS